MVEKKRGRPPKKPLTIAVDAGGIGVTDERLKAGVYTVALNLLRELSQFDQRNRYILFSFSPIEQTVMEELGDRFTNRVLPRLGWFSLWLPLALRFTKHDIFLALNQAMPKQAGTTIGFIYDVVFEKYPEGYQSSYKKLQQHSRQVATHAQSLLTISHASQEEVIEMYGVPHSKIRVCYPGVAASFNVEGAKFVHTKPFFLYVGALKKTKNIPFLLRAFAQFLENTHELFDLVLVGSDYWMDFEITQTIKEKNLKDRVIIKGYVSSDELASFYRGATAFVSPSLFEGFGLPVVEAMACGCPVIATKIPAVEEIVGDAALLVAPTKERELVDALLVISQDKKLRSDLSKKALLQAQKFSWRTFAKTVFVEIEKLSSIP